MTAPFASSAAQLVRTSHTQVVRARVVDAAGDPVTDLDVEAGRLSFDERRAPRVVLELDSVVPAGEDTLAAIDGRRGARVVVDAGYLQPGTLLEDVHTVADLALVDRVVDRPGNVMRLTAESDERLFIDAGPPSAAVKISVSGAGTADAMRALIADQLPAARIVNTYPAGPQTTFDQLGEDPWQALDTLADTIDADVYDDGLRTWRIEPRPTLSPVASHQLAVGAAGTILTSSTTLSRGGTDAEGWYNHVELLFTDTDQFGTSYAALGSAQQATGPYGTGTTRRKYLERREQRLTAAQAQAAAEAKLRRTLSRGRSFTLSALAAWWLRPGHTVTVRLPTGPQERHLVQSVTFDLAAGRMTLTTRLPFPTDTSTGG